MSKKKMFLLLLPVAAALLYTERFRLYNWLRWQYIEPIGGLA